MPKGLLDKLTREEILDLIAYVAAKGDAKDPLFQGGMNTRGMDIESRLAVHRPRA